MFSTCCHQVRVTRLEKRLVTRALAKVSKVSKVLDSLICQVLPIFYSPQLKIILTFENQSFPGTTLRPRLPHSREGRKCTRSNCSTGIAMSKTAKKGECRFFFFFFFHSKVALDIIYTNSTNVGGNCDTLPLKCKTLISCQPWMLKRFSAVLQVHNLHLDLNDLMMSRCTYLVE